MSNPSAPVHRERLAELDALTDHLPKRASHLARRLDRVFTARVDEHGRLCIEGRPVCPVCLGGPCDCLVDHEPAPVPVTSTPLCPWCLETDGFCTATGGPNPCEGEGERIEAFAELEAAPEINIPFRFGGV